MPGSSLCTASLATLLPFAILIKMEGPLLGVINSSRLLDQILLVPSLIGSNSPLGWRPTDENPVQNVILAI